MARWKTAPAEDLAPFVEGIAFSTDDAAPAPVRVVPDGCIDLLLSADEGGQRDRPCRADVFGTKTRALSVEDSVPVENIAVSFRPGAARAFLGVPASEVTDRAVPLAELWGDGAAALARGVASTETASERQRLVERALRLRLSQLGARESMRNSVAANMVAEAVAALVASRGGVSVRDLCSQTGCGERRLERWFRDRVGVSPKRLARILRFRASYAALAAGVPQAQVAWQLGFADQAHLLRDFRAFGGAAPAVVFGRDASGRIRSIRPADRSPILRA